MKLYICTGSGGPFCGDCEAQWPSDCGGGDGWFCAQVEANVRDVRVDSGDGQAALARVIARLRGMEVTP